MQTVPSLIGTGTAIAAAASGLVFAQPVESTVTTIRPSQHRAKVSFDRDLPITARLSSLPPSRAGTSSETPSICTEASNLNTLSNPPSSSRPPLSRYQRPSTSHITSSKGVTRRPSLMKQREASGSTTGEGPRDSVSSNGSWMKWLAIRPLSQHGSLRSSLGLDSPSVTLSHGSSAPILSRPHTAAQPLPPNKLVKRSPSIQNNASTGVSRSRSKSHLPTLRRPATSHQRSATLQQFRPEVDLANLSTSPKCSFDQQVRPQGFLDQVPTGPSRGIRKTSGWTSFFHSRTASIGSRLGESSYRSRSVSAKRISLLGDERNRVHLVKPRMVSTCSAPAVLAFSADLREEPHHSREESEADLEKPSPSPENPPTVRAKRSLSMPFTSTSNWLSRTSDNLRRPKRGAEPHSENGRHVSAPVAGVQITVGHDFNARVSSSIPPIVPAMQGPPLDSAANLHHQLPTHKRNHSSPLPPLPRDSTFHIDLPRLGSPGGAATRSIRPNQPSGSSTSSAAMSQLRASPLHERSSVIEGSESDTRGFISGDDDDTDFKSDTMYDSLRTAASSRMRAVESPLESVYDESPPGTAGNGKTKRLSIHEILGSAWDDDNKIVEEDENLATPSRTSGDAETDYVKHNTLSVPRLSSDSSHNALSLSAREFGRLSLDDDFDEDWAEDVDDAPFSPLSPPSKGGSLNARGINPNVRLALANLNVNQMAEANRNDRPLSSLFDWSESSVYDKHDADGYSSRPKTAYGKPEMDSRGGRSASRKGPAPAHVRSQSVPIVHDVSDDSKQIGAKYGTWGMGTKTVSEDWDEDFEFGSGVNDNDGKGNSNNHLFAVPESIRASQPSVRAHSGQIRELSLLVNDLKRLCRHGKDMDMLNGPQRALWKEAEGVIALASPDEDSMDEDHETNSSINLDAFDANEQLLDDGFDVASLSRIDAASFDGQEPVMSKTAVVRERQSPKRRSVFSPEDDIFGGNWPLVDESAPPSRSSRPRTPVTRTSKPHDVTGVARSVMEAMHRSVPHQTREVRNDNKMHFDTNSLKVLVRRAGELRDTLADLIRRAEQITQSPIMTPRHERHPESSPAFTRVFDDPGSSPPRRAIRSRGNNSLLDGTSPEKSPSSAMNRRLQTMTVS